MLGVIYKQKEYEDAGEIRNEDDDKSKGSSVYGTGKGF